MQNRLNKSEEIEALKQVAISENKTFLYNAIQALHFGATEVHLLQVINSMENAMESLRNEVALIHKYGGKVIALPEGIISVDKAMEIMKVGDKE